MAAKKKAAAPASHQHQLESDYLSPAQKKVFKHPTPRVAKVAESDTTAKKSTARKSAPKKASTRKRAAATQTEAATPAASE